MTGDGLRKAKALADQWREQQKLSDEASALAAHFQRATPHELIKMWESGNNLQDRKLSAFELGALIERWIAVFGSLPPDDDDIAEMVASEEVASASVPELPADATMLRAKDVVRFTGLSLSTIKRMVLDGRFPKPVRLSPRRLGWPAVEVKAWLAPLTEARSRTKH